MISGGVNNQQGNQVIISGPRGQSRLAHRTSVSLVCSLVQCVLYVLVHSLFQRVKAHWSSRQKNVVIIFDIKFITWNKQKSIYRLGVVFKGGYVTKWGADIYHIRSKGYETYLKIGTKSIYCGYRLSALTPRSNPSINSTNSFNRLQTRPVVRDKEKLWMRKFLLTRLQTLTIRLDYLLLFRKCSRAPSTSIQIVSSQILRAIWFSGRFTIAEVSYPVSVLLSFAVPWSWFRPLCKHTPATKYAQIIQ